MTVDTRSAEQTACSRPLIACFSISQIPWRYVCMKGNGNEEVWFTATSKEDGKSPGQAECPIRRCLIGAAAEFERQIPSS